MKTLDKNLGAMRQSQACASTALYQPAFCRVCALAALALSASACTSLPPTSATSPVSAAGPTQMQTQESAAPVPTAPAATALRQALRVIVKFRPGVAYRDGALLQAIGDNIQARIVYLASVSADTHVYRIELRADLSPAEIMRRLSDMPSVLHAEADARVQPL